MNQSKTGLNDLFYKWIDDLRRADRFLQEYPEKFKYLEVKLIGYKSVSFDQIMSTISNFKSDESIIYWLDRIDQLDKQREISDELLRSYWSLKESLTLGQSRALRMIVDLDNFYKGNSYFQTSSFKQFRNLVIRKWEEKFKNR